MASAAVNVPARWTGIPWKPEQNEWFWTKSRFNLCTAPRRSGKTEIRKRATLYRTWLDRLNPHPMGRNRFFFAPTEGQAKQIYWQDLLSLVPKSWVKVENHTDLLVKTHWGTTVRVVGMDRPERIEGIDLDEANIDEVANVKRGIWEAHIRPMIRSDGQVFFYGVPDKAGPNQLEYYKMVTKAKEGKDPQWRHFHWSSEGIIDPATLDSDKHDMDPLLYRQERGGEFVSDGGQFVPDFDYSRNVRDNLCYDPNLPLCWTLDFNIQPQCSLLCQHRKGIVYVLREIVLSERATTDVVVAAFLEITQKLMWNPRGVNIYGDSSGKKVTTTSQNAEASDWYIIQNGIKNLSYEYKVSPRWIPIGDTRNALNARVQNAAGDCRLLIDSSCHRLIDDMRSALWPSTADEQHCLAALRYFCHAEYPVTPDAMAQRGRVGFSNARD